MPRAVIDPWGRPFSKSLSLDTMKLLCRHAVAIREICKELGLKPDDKRDQRALLAILTGIMFGMPGGNALLPARIRGSAGRKKKRDRRWLTSIRRDIVSASGISADGKGGDFRVSILLRRLRAPKKYGPFKLDYSSFKDSTLKKYLRLALKR